VHKKELKRIDWDIVKRILHLLYDEGKTKKTHIATKCNLNYDQTILYLEWMTMVNFIRKISDGKSEAISLSNIGLILYREKIKDLGTFLV
jgi:predicted transcriptional regulator